MLDNPEHYVFSSITASVDGPVSFEATAEDSDLGTLSVSMNARFIINDGQHRRAAIESAISENPELAEETISVVLFIDGGLHRSQQMFADLNQYAIRPTKSIGILYDLRSPLAQLARALVDEVGVFKKMTETERTSISNRSLKLFTLSSIHQGTKSLLGKQRAEEIDDTDKLLAVAYWEEVSKHIPEWSLAASRKVATSELRKEYIHSHGLALHALGLVGFDLIRQHPKDWKKQLSALSKVDWLRKNNKIWEGRALVSGRVSKASINVHRTAIYLKNAIGLTLSSDDEKVEAQMRASS